MRAFVVAPHTKLQCASCVNEVHCIASVAFAGRMHQCCPHCKHPRCLVCVQKAIEGKPLPNPSPDGKGKCLFCTRMSDVVE